MNSVEGIRRQFLIQKGCHLSLIGVMPLVLASCSNGPRSTMESFCKELSAGQWERAIAALGDQSEMHKALGDLEKDPQNKQLVTALLGSAKCSITASKDNTVSVAMDTVNGTAVMGKVMADSVGLALMSAFGGADGNKMVEEAMLAKIVEGFSSPNAPRSKTTIEVQMEQRGGHWVPGPGNDAFASALVGGIDKFGQ